MDPMAINATTPVTSDTSSPFFSSAVGEAWPWRLGAALAGTYALTAAYALLEVPMQLYPGWLAPLFLLLLCGIGSLLAACVERPSPRLIHALSIYLPVLFICSAFFIGLLSIASTRPYGTDEMAFAADAANVLIHGHNPYLALMQAPPGFVSGSYTPTTAGTFVQTLSYPALSFLAYVPWLLLGVHNMSFANLAYMLVALFLLAIWTPPVWRFIGLFAILLVTQMPDAVGAITDILYVVPLLATVRYLRPAPLWAAVAFGLACATKQTPWFAAPFLLIAVWYEAEAKQAARPWRETIRFAAIAVGVFLAVNLPFILWSPMAWLHGATLPMFDHLVPLGIGLVEIARLPFRALPPSALSLIPLGVLTLFAAFVLAAYRRAPAAIFAAPPLAFLFASRSLQNYVMFYLPVVFLAMALWTEDGSHRIKQAASPVDGSLRPAPYRPLAIAGTAIIGMALIAGGTVAWARQPDAAVARVLAAYSRHGHTILRITATNTSAQPLVVAYFISSPSQFFVLWPAPHADRTLRPHSTIHMKLVEPLPMPRGSGAHAPLHGWVQITLATPAGVQYSGPVHRIASAHKQG